MSELVIPVGNKGDRLKLEDSGGVLVAVLNPGEEPSVISMVTRPGQIVLGAASLYVGGASFFGLTAAQLAAVRSWLTEQGHKFVDAAEPHSPPPKEVSPC